MAGTMRTFVTDRRTEGLTDATDFKGHSVCPKSETESYIERNEF